MRQLGLIGGGYWGKNLIRDFNKLNVLHTICDINNDALKEYNEMYPHVNTTTNWSEVLNNKEITSVCIALPAHMHYEYAKKSLESDKDVYIEKPITLDIKEAEELVSLAKNKTKILMVGHLLHYHPAIQKIKEMVNNDIIGDVVNIISNRFSLGIYREFENVLWSFAVHDLSVILSLCNNELPDSVSCNGNSSITKNVQDITNSVLKYKNSNNSNNNNNKYVNVNVSWISPYKEQKLTVIGTKGILMFDDVNKKLIHIPEYVNYSKKDDKNDKNNNTNPVAIKNNEINIEYSNESPLLKECQHFINCCSDRISPITNGEEGVRVLKLLTKLQESLNNDGKEIVINNNNEPIVNNNIFIHDTACVDEGANIGENTKIWHYSHICKGSQIGKNCNIGQNVFIADGVILGDNCKVQNNVSIYKGVIAKNNVFFGPSCVLTNDINPRCAYPKNGEYMKTILNEGVTLGANSTIVCGNTIGENALIGAGAVVCKDVEANSIIVGNPGKKIGEINEKGTRTMIKK